MVLARQDLVNYMEVDSMRLFVSMLLSIPMIFGIFLFMGQLVPIEADVIIEVPDEPTPPNPVKFINKVTPTPTQELPENPPPPVRPITTSEIPANTPRNITVLPPAIDTPEFSTVVNPNGYGKPDYRDTSGTQEAIPFLIKEPLWPLNAARSGSVRFCFTVNSDGSVENIKLIAAEPQRLFTRSARRAISKWKFKPALSDGIAVRKDNMCYTMKFNYTGDAQ